jgi:hypothetical protein
MTTTVRIVPVGNDSSRSQLPSLDRASHRLTNILEAGISESERTRYGDQDVGDRVDMD